MRPKLMMEPSRWLGTGIKLEVMNGLRLFKLSDELQARSDVLLERSKTGLMTVAEQAELDGISELAQIFTYANSVLAAELEWLPTPSENLLPNEPPIAVDTAIPQNSSAAIASYWIFPYQTPKSFIVSNGIAVSIRFCHVSVFGVKVDRLLEECDRSCI